MRRILIVALVWAGLLGAQDVSQTRCEVTAAGSIRLSWLDDISDGSNAVRCRFADNASLTGAEFVRTDQVNLSGGTDNGGRRDCIIYTAPDDATVYVLPESSNSAQSSWVGPVCTGSGTNVSGGDFATDSGCNCGGAGQPPYVTTTVTNSDPTPEAPTTAAVTSPPTVDGGTYSVASACADLSTKHNSAETDAETNQVAKLELPVGECPVTSLALRDVSAGTILITGAADPKLLRPPGQRTDGTDRAHKPKITFASMADFGGPLITAADSAKNYYIQDVDIGPPDLDSAILTPITMTVSAVDEGTDTITVNSTAGLATGNSGQMVVVNLPGITSANGPYQVGNVTATTFKLYTGCTTKGSCNGSSEGTLVDLKGTYSGGGVVRRWVALPVESIADCGDGTACLEITGHGIADYPSMTISGSPAANQIAVPGTPADYGLAVNKTVHIEGTGVGTCDGLRQVTVIAGSTLTLTRSGQSTDCTGASSGTVHRHRAASLFKTSIAALGDEVPQSWHFERVDDDHLQLLESSYAAATGGYFFWEVEPMPVLIDLAGSSMSDIPSKITLDGVSVGACFPWTFTALVSEELTDNNAVVNSDLRSCSWQRVDPVTGLTDRVHGYSQAHITMGVRRSDGLVLRNNRIGPRAFVFADDARNGSLRSCTSNLTVEQNTFWSEDAFFELHPSYRRHYLHSGFSPMELKSACGPIRFYGNYVKGFGKSNFAQNAPAIELSHNGAHAPDPNGPHDVYIGYSVFDRGAGFLTIARTELDGQKMQLPIERVMVEHNVVRETDTLYYSDDPGDATGAFVQLWAGGRNITIRRNTLLPHRCNNCRILDMDGMHVAGLNLTDNILGVAGGANTNRLGFYLQTPGVETPAFTQAGGLAAFQDFVRRGYASDYGVGSSISGNVLLPMNRATTTGTYAVKAASADPADTYCQSALAAEAKMASIPGTYVGNTNSPCDQSLNTRLALLFETGTLKPVSPTYDGKGADVGAVAAAMGRCGPVTAAADDVSGDLSWLASGTAEVTVDVAPWDTDWATTFGTAGNITRGQTADGATAAKTYAASGLDPLTAYAYRAGGGACPQGFHGRFTTAGSAGGGGGGPAIPTEGLVAHYAITEGSGQTLTDDSGNGNHAQLGSTAGSDANDPTWGTSGGETVLVFDDSNDYVTTGLSLGGGNRTILCAVNLSTPETGQNGIAMNSAGNQGFYENSGALHSYNCGGEQTGPTLTPSEWHVVWMKQDGTTNYLGIDKGTPTSASCTLDATDPIIIGNTNFETWKGPIADCAFYSGALTQEQIDAYVDWINAAKPGLFP